MKSWKNTLSAHARVLTEGHINMRNIAKKSTFIVYNTDIFYSFFLKILTQINLMTRNISVSKYTVKNIFLSNRQPSHLRKQTKTRICSYIFHYMLQNSAMDYHQTYMDLFRIDEAMIMPNLRSFGVSLGTKFGERKLGSAGPILVVRA